MKLIYGESSDSRLRIGWSTVFPEWKSSLWLFVKVSGSENACPDSDPRSFGDCPVPNGTVCGFLFSRALDGEKITLC